MFRFSKVVAPMRPCLALLAGVLCVGVTIGRSSAQAPSPRAEVQHALRRFAFSASPETVSAVVASGIGPWIASQENWPALDDSGSELETLPTTFAPGGGFIDYNVFERLVMQHMMLTPRQLQAKLELHWLDHFAVGLGKVGDPAMMYHYDQTVRANALGNFATLLTAVAKEPAMLIWLDNNNNAGAVANENFARECMQLYSMGLTRLNMDGSTIDWPGGGPVPNYSQADVQDIARAITGYSVYVDWNGTNPETRFSTQYVPGNHYTGAVHFLGAARTVPTDGTALDYVMGIIARRPSVAPFMARELLQRFATETPSAQFISDIAAVWRAKQDAPDQIAQVITAIVNHPEFPTSYHAMSKQPVEIMMDSLRALPGALQTTANTTPGNSLLWELSNLGQQLFWPASVFSFYHPGDLSSLTNTGTVLARTWILANITNADPAGSYTDTYLDMPTLRARIGNTSGIAVRDYLLDALLDGGSSDARRILGKYLGDTPSDNQIRGGIWLLLNSPDFAVN
jgi:hypothetical protein